MRPAKGVPDFLLCRKKICALGLAALFLAASGATLPARSSPMKALMSPPAGHQSMATGSSRHDWNGARVLLVQEEGEEGAGDTGGDSGSSGGFKGQRKTNIGNNAGAPSTITMFFRLGLIRIGVTITRPHEDYIEVRIGNRTFRIRVKPGQKWAWITIRGKRFRVPVPPYRKTTKQAKKPARKTPPASKKKPASKPRKQKQQQKPPRQRTQSFRFGNMRGTVTRYKDYVEVRIGSYRARVGVKPGQKSVSVRVGPFRVNVPVPDYDAGTTTGKKRQTSAAAKTRRANSKKRTGTRKAARPAQQPKRAATGTRKAARPAQQPKRTTSSPKKVAPSTQRRGIAIGKPEAKGNGNRCLQASTPECK